MTTILTAAGQIQARYVGCLSRAGDRTGTSLWVGPIASGSLKLDNVIR